MFTFLISADTDFLLAGRTLTPPFKGVRHKAVSGRGGETVEALIVEPVTRHLLHGPSKTLADCSVPGKSIC